MALIEHLLKHLPQLLLFFLFERVYDHYNYTFVHHEFKDNNVIGGVGVVEGKVITVITNKPNLSTSNQIGMVCKGLKDVGCCRIVLSWNSS